jgi:hypothetical protein
VKRSESNVGPYTEIGTTIPASYTDNSASNGTTYYYVVTATNTAGESSESGEVSGQPLGPYEVWANTAGLTGLPGSATDPASDADPEGDGTSNSLEWVLGGNPLASDPAVMPLATRDPMTGALTLTFKRAFASIGLVSLEVHYGGSLAFGQVASVGELSSGADANGVIIDVAAWDLDYDLVTVTIPASNASGGALFSRLVETQL